MKFTDTKEDVELNAAHNSCCLKFMKRLPSESVNLIYTDVPYNMGSEYTIDTKGHYRFKGKGSDFMGTWVAMDGLWWNDHFKEAARVLKVGGFYVTHLIDRQSDMWSYYARRNGLFPMQKLYWLFIDNFPKGVDAGLMLDKLQGVERTVIGKAKGAQASSTGQYGSWGNDDGTGSSVYDMTAATSEIAKKYDGYKYGQAALKQTIEEILVFWKVAESVPREIVKLEQDLKAGRPSGINGGLWNIKDTRVPDIKKSDLDRWTPQLIIDSRVRVPLINQLGHAVSAKIVTTLPQIEYADDELIPYKFCSKTSKTEKEAGLEEMEATVKRTAGKGLIGANGKEKFQSESKNSHTTAKPIALAKWVLSLFALPDRDKMLVYDPFSGQGTHLRACKEMGIPYIGTELNPEFCKIINMKFQHMEKLESTKQFDMFGGAL